MKSTGMVRPVDELGRVVLPKELRDTMDIAIKDPLEIFVDGKMILLKQYQPGCILCNSMKDIIDFKGKKICQECRESFKK